MPARRPPSDDPAERRRQLVIALEQYNAALDQNTADHHAGRMTPTFGRGALDVLKKRVRQARADVDALDEQALA